MATFSATPKPNGISQRIIKKKLSAESAAGYYMARSAGSVAKKEFTILYKSLTAAERDTLQTFFDTNQGLAITWVHPETGGASYNVAFSDDELNFEHDINIDKWAVTVKLREL